MPRPIDNEKDWGYEEDCLEGVPSDETFHIGQSYEEVAATTQRCKKCGGTEFNLGIGEYFTAIRCPKCEWEVCVHNG